MASALLSLFVTRSGFVRTETCSDEKKLQVIQFARTGYTHVDELSYPGSDVPCIASLFKYL